MQFAAQVPTLIFYRPTGIFVFTGGGVLNAYRGLIGFSGLLWCVLLFYFNGFLLFATCGLNDGGIDDGCSLCFELVLCQLLVDLQH